MEFFAKTGRKVIASVSTVGRASMMFWGAVVAKPRPLKSVPLTIKQMYVVGVQSLLIIMVSGLFIGMVMAL